VSALVDFEVTLCTFEELTPAEQAGTSTNGCGKEYANYIRVKRGSQTIWLESDAMEPEDARFTRDLSWIKEALDYAYQCGIADGRRQAKQEANL
jgi:hypothetical protein